LDAATSATASRPVSTLEASAPVSHIRLALEPQGGVGERTLVLENDTGSVREVIGHVASAQRCAATVARHDLRELTVGCGLTLHATARLGGPSTATPPLDGEADRIALTIAHLGSRGDEQRSIALDHSTKHALDDSLVDPSPPGCLPVAAGTPPRIDVRVDRDWVADGAGSTRAPVLVLRVPRLRIEHRLTLEEHEYCHGHEFPAAGRLDVTCEVYGSSVTLHVRIRDGALFLSSDWGDDDGASTEVLGGVAIPCGAMFAWPRVHWPNPKWAPYGDSATCRYRYDLCEDRCTKSFTDAEGHFTDRGNDCETRCWNALSACREQTAAK
jgi:hypothetical protein